MAEAGDDSGSKLIGVAGLLIGLGVFTLSWVQQRRATERQAEASARAEQVAADSAGVASAPAGGATDLADPEASWDAMLAEERAERLRWVRRVWAHLDEDAAAAFGMLNESVEHASDGEAEYVREYELRWGSLTGQLTCDVTGLPWRDAIRLLAQQLGYEIQVDERRWTWNLIDPEGVLEDDPPVEVESLILDDRTGEVVATLRDHERRRLVFPKGASGDGLRASLQAPLPVGPLRTVVSRPRRDGRRQLVAWLEPGQQQGLARIVAGDISLSSLQRALYPYGELNVDVNDAAPDVRVNLDAADVNRDELLIAVAESFHDQLMVFERDGLTQILPFELERLRWALELDTSTTDAERLALVPSEGYPSSIPWPTSFDAATRDALLLALAEGSAEAWATWDRDPSGERTLRSFVIMAVERGP